MKQKGIEIIKRQEKILALILRNEFQGEDLQFFTPSDFSFQLGFHSHKKGKIVQAHIHKSLKRKISDTEELLIIKRGKIKINFYTIEKEFVTSRELQTGDIVLFVQGGHELRFLKDGEFFEVKQGPYFGEKEKEKFKGIEES